MIASRSDPTSSVVRNSHPCRDYIIRLTADHVVVREKGVLLRLGKEPLELSPELGNLIQQIAADRRRDGQIGQIDAPLTTGMVGGHRAGMW